MSDGRKFYCLCDSNCKYETMTKEQILAAIAQAVETGSVGDCDTGFITKLKEQNSGSGVTLWVGTQAQYNAIEKPAENCLYIITDDTNTADLLAYVQTVGETAAAAAATAGAAAATADKANANVNAVAAMANRADKRAEEAIYAINGMKSTPITDEVELSWIVNSGGAAATQLDFVPIRYEYCPTTGIVHFAFKMAWKGKLTKGEFIRAQHIGGYYKPNLRYVDQYPTAATVNSCTAVYGGEDPDSPEIMIRVNEDIESNYTSAYIFSGWYFCDEESVG